MFRKKFSPQNLVLQISFLNDLMIPARKDSVYAHWRLRGLSSSPAPYSCCRLRRAPLYTSHLHECFRQFDEWCEVVLSFNCCGRCSVAALAKNRLYCQPGGRVIPMFDSPVQPLINIVKYGWDLGTKNANWAPIEQTIEIAVDRYERISFAHTGRTTTNDCLFAGW